MLAKWIELLALFAAVGALVTSSGLLPPESTWTDGEASAHIGAASHRILGVAAAALGLASVGLLVSRTASMTGRSIAKALPFLSAVLFQSSYGGVWFALVGACAVLAVAWTGLRARPQSRAALGVALAALGTIAWTVAASGHAGDWGRTGRAVWIDALHVVAGSAWGGTLIAYAVAVHSELEARAPAERAAVARLIHRLSRLATVGLGVVIATGIYNAAAQLGGVRPFVTTRYGWILDAKLALVAAVVGLGAVNHFGHAPRLRAWGQARSGEAGTGAAILFRFGRAVTAEAWLFAAILLCTALLSTQSPMAPHGVP